MITSRPLCFPDPVPDRANLYDRIPALADVLDSVRHRTTVVLGARLIGKTSLLNVVARSAEEQGEFAIIRLAPTDSRVAFMAEILDSVHQWVDEHHRDSLRMLAPGRKRGRVAIRRPSTTADRPIAPQQPVGTVAQFCQRIATLAGRATDVMFLLCVDEFDSLIKNWDEHEARLVLELMAHLDTMPNLPLRFLLTMSTVPDLLLNSFRSPILNQSKIVTLEPWDADEAAQFVEWLVGDRLVFDEAASAALFAAAGGHPYFTKAVLNAVLAGLAHPSGSGQLTAANVAAVVRQAVRSPEVNLSLRNLVSAHISADAVAILDRAGNNPAGVTARNLSDLPSAGQSLGSLQTDGLLRQQGDRYLLRLGLWREWRAATPNTSHHVPVLRRIGRAVRRVRRQRATSYILFLALAGPLLALLVTTAYLAPERTFIEHPCGVSGARLTIHVTYPAFASVGDSQQIHVVVVNNGQTDAQGSALVSFTAGQALVDGANGIPFGLHPAEQAPMDVTFTATARSSPVRAELSVSAGQACQTHDWSIVIAPISRLQQIQKIAGTVLVIFLIPLVVEYVATRFLRVERGSRVDASVPKGS